MREFALTLSLLLVATGALAAGDADRGKALYATKCSACHSLDYNGVGPAHKGVFGRKAGSAEGYAYSPALQGSGLTWNEANLDRWLANPAKLVPGQKMGITVPNARERGDLIAYLKAAAK